MKERDEKRKKTMTRFSPLRCQSSCRFSISSRRTNIQRLFLFGQARPVAAAAVLLLISRQATKRARVVRSYVQWNRMISLGENLQYFSQFFFPHHCGCFLFYFGLFGCWQEIERERDAKISYDTPSIEK
jgi:hypothetical protein